MGHVVLVRLASTLSEKPSTLVMQCIAWKKKAQGSASKRALETPETSFQVSTRTRKTPRLSSRTPRGSTATASPQPCVNKSQGTRLPLQAARRPNRSPLANTKGGAVPIARWQKQLFTMGAQEPETEVASSATRTSSSRSTTQHYWDDVEVVQALGERSHRRCPSRLHNRPSRHSCSPLIALSSM